MTLRMSFNKPVIAAAALVLVFIPAAVITVVSKWNISAGEKK